MGVTKERIRQIEARALHKLRMAAQEEKIEVPGLIKPRSRNCEFRRPRASAAAAIHKADELRPRNGHFQETGVLHQWLAAGLLLDGGGLFLHAPGDTIVYSACQ